MTESQCWAARPPKMQAVVHKPHTDTDNSSCCAYLWADAVAGGWQPDGGEALLGPV
jgi:hypothetical protein